MGSVGSGWTGLQGSGVPLLRRNYPSLGGLLSFFRKFLFPLSSEKERKRRSRGGLRPSSGWEKEIDQAFQLEPEGIAYIERKRTAADHEDLSPHAGKEGVPAPPWPFAGKGRRRVKDDLDTETSGSIRPRKKGDSLPTHMTVTIDGKYFKKERPTPSLMCCMHGGKGYRRTVCCS